MNMELNGRFIRNFQGPKYISVIEIGETDDIYKDIEFLDYDLNYQEGYGYEIYKNQFIFSIHFPNGGEAACASGKVIDIYNNNFDHNIPTNLGSGGCPILLLRESINFIKVIGVHHGKYVPTQLLMK